MAQSDGPGFLDDLPDLDLPDPTPLHGRKPETDPVRRLMARVSPLTEARYERLRTACDQVYGYCMVPEIKKYWVRQLEEVASSAELTLVPETEFQWPDDNAKFYAVMGVCVQRCMQNIVVIPRHVRETKWYRLHEWSGHYRRDIPFVERHARLSAAHVHPRHAHGLEGE